MNNIIRHTTNPKYLDNIIYLLPAPNILSTEERNKNYRVVLLIKDIFRKFIIFIKRIAYKLFHDGVWYNEARAHQLVKDYIDYIHHPNCHAAFKSQHHKILEIYNRLAHLSRGKGSWADGLDANVLISLNQELDFEKQQCFHKQRMNILSTLDEAYPFSINNLPRLTNKQLFHLHADEFGNSSELEGLKQFRS